MLIYPCLIFCLKINGLIIQVSPYSLFKIQVSLLCHVKCHMSVSNNFVTASCLITNFYPIRESNYKFLNYRDLFEN